LQLRSFVKNLAFVQLVNFIVKPLWILAIDRYVQNQIGLELYGQYYLVFNLSAMLFIISDLGLNNFMTKEAVDHELSSLNVLRATGLVKLILSILFFVFLFFISFSRGLDIKLVCWVGINQLLLSSSQWLRVWFNANRQFKRESLLAVIDRIVALLLWFGVIMLFGIKNQNMLSWFLGVQTIGLLTAVVVSIFLLYKQNIKSFDLAENSFKKVVIACLPFTLLSFFMAAYTRIDVVLMDFILPNANYHIGVYAQGYRILDASNMFAAVFASMLLPIFTKQINNRESVLPIVRTSSLLIGASCIGLIVILGIWGEAIYHLLYSKNTNLDPQTLGYRMQTFCTVILCYIPIAFIYIFGTYLTAFGKLKFLVSLAFACLVLNIVLNYWFISQYQALGSAIVALITQSVFSVTCIIYSLFLLRKRVSF